MTTMSSMLSHPFHNSPLILSFGKALQEARWAARIVGFLHSLSTFLAFCSLTWATVVLLGAFVSDLHFADYSFVIALLLLQAARLASTTLFSEILTHSLDPSHLANCTADDFRRPIIARFLSLFFQVLLIASSFTCAIIRLLTIRFYGPGSVNLLQISLRIFYVLVIFNACISSLNLFGSFVAWIRLKDPSELSILSYYDKILQNVLANGVIQADNFNFFQIAFKILGRNYAKYNDWQTVVDGNKKLLTYIYAHKQGTDYLQICLDSEDASVRQAAANMVGMWADEKRGVGLKTEDVEFPPELLMKLADMVGTGEVGWAATNSFGALAKRNPQYLVQTRTSSNEPVLHRIAELVNESSTRSLAAVRMLVLFYIQIFLLRSSEQREASMTATASDSRFSTCTDSASRFENDSYSRDVAHYNDDAGGHIAQNGMQAVVHAAAGSTAENMAKRALTEGIKVELVRKLKHLLKKNKVHRLRVQSAYLLYLLGELDAQCDNLISSITPAVDTHWYSIEKKMLEFFLTRMPHPPTPPTYPSHVWPDHEVIYEGDYPF